MKSLLYLRLVLSRRVVIPGVLYGLVMMIWMMPSPSLANQGGDEFPDDRRGGGTHVSD